MTIIYWCWLCSAIGAAQQPPLPSTDPPRPAQTSTAISPEQIQHWISDLGARRFDDRDRAMQSLIAAGPAALSPTLDAAFVDDREVGVRSIVILQEIGARGDNNVLQSALAGLEKIAANAPSAVVAQQASEAKKSLGAVRQTRTIEYLTRLGAAITPEGEDRWFQSLNTRDEPLFVVEIGPQWRGTEKDLERLRWIVDAHQVNFIGPQVKDSWFQYLNGMESLFSVKVKHANISKAAVESLAHTKGVWLLRLLYVPLDDEAVARLEESKSLLFLVVISRNLTDKGVTRLQERFGKDKAKCPRGALLGITAQTHITNGWMITEVLEGSAAEKAGLRAMDRIVKYDGHLIGDFDSLKSLIDKNEPGDTVTVEVERGMELVEKKITFGEWE